MTTAFDSRSTCRARAKEEESHCACQVAAHDIEKQCKQTVCGEPGVLYKWARTLFVSLSTLMPTQLSLSLPPPPPHPTPLPPSSFSLSLSVSLIALTPVLTQS